MALLHPDLLPSPVWLPFAHDGATLARDEVGGDRLAGKHPRLHRSVEGRRRSVVTAHEYRVVHLPLSQIVEFGPMVVGWTSLKAQINVCPKSMKEKHISNKAQHCLVSTGEKNKCKLAQREATEWEEKARHDRETKKN